MLTSLYIVALEAIPSEDWCRTWPADRTIMLRKTSKRVKETVDKIRPPVIVRLNNNFWDYKNDTTRTIIMHLNLLAIECKIITLEIKNCNIEKFVELFTEGLRQCPDLENLDLSGNQFNNIHSASLARLDKLAEVIGQCSKLKRLKLNTNFIGDRIERLMEQLIQCSNLTHLELQYNDIGPIGASTIAGMLPQFPALTHLYLSGNKIGDMGAESFASVLNQCQTLNEFKLNRNEIRDYGAISFARVLKKCSKLTLLDLSNNFIGANGVISFAANISNCKVDLITFYQN
jgi:Ran GTPase-activating protein (RanGAP) involved in mRNA processing and transport